MARRKRRSMKRRLAVVAVVAGAVYATVNGAGAHDAYRHWDAEPVFETATGLPCIGALEFEDFSALAICGGLVYGYDPADASVAVVAEYSATEQRRLMGDIMRDDSIGE